MKMNTIYIPLRLVFALLIGLLVLVPSAFSHAETVTDEQLDKLGQLSALVSYLERTYTDHGSPALSAGEMESIIEEATDWMIASQEDSGHFAYEYDTYVGSYIDDDNIVRQAGALFQLGEVARRVEEPSPELQETIESAIEYFESLSKEDEFLGDTFRCIVQTDESEKCKLGATSLAVIGILGYVEAYPEKADEYDDLIEDYIAYILNAKHLDAGFRNVHIVGINQQPNAESPFSNGEAMLALVRYTGYKENAGIDNIIDDVFVYLSEQEYDTALYLWIMAALKDLQAREPDQRYTGYTKGFTDWRMQGAGLRKGTNKNYCAYTEGIASAYSVLESSSTPEENQALRTELDFWNKKNSRLQIGVFDTHRVEVIDNSITFLEIPDMNQALGGFLTSDETLTQRIDFTQHCISAYLQTLVDIDGATI